MELNRGRDRETRAQRGGRLARASSGRGIVRETRVQPGNGRGRSAGVRDRRIALGDGNGPNIGGESADDDESENGFEDHDDIECRKRE